MRTQFETILKKLFYEHQTKTRAEMRLTQAQMARLLKTELRSYSDLDQCKTSCSALTLVCYLIYCCEDPISFLSDLHAAFKPLSDIEPKGLCLMPHSESLSYRMPLQVTEIFVTGDGEHFPVCPRCGVTLEREYMRYCDRCGQKLDWINFPKSAKVRTAQSKNAKNKCAICQKLQQYVMKSCSEVSVLVQNCDKTTFLSLLCIDICCLYVSI